MIRPAELALVVVERQALQLRPDAQPQREHDPLGRAPGDERRRRSARPGRRARWRGRPAAAPNSTPCESPATPLSTPVLTRYGPASPASASSTTSTRPISSGRRNCAQQAEQAELALGARSRSARSTSAVVAHRRQRRDLGEQLRRRPAAGRGRAPVPAAAAAEPGAQRRRGDGGAGRGAVRRRRAATPTAVTPSAGELGQRLDAVAGRAQRLASPGRRAARGRTALRALSSSCVPSSTTRPPSSTTTRSARCRVETRCATSTRGAPGQHVAQPVVDRLLGARVDRARRVVEHEDAWVGQDGAGQRDPLPLPAGQRQPALADHGVVAGRQVARRSRRPARCGRPPRSRRRSRPGRAVGDVGADRVGEQEALLEGDADARGAASAASRRARRGRRRAPRPPSGSCWREISEASVDLPLPLGPTSATRSPAAMCRSTPSQHGRGRRCSRSVTSSKRDLTAQVGQLDRVRRVGDRRLQVEQRRRCARPRRGPAGRR